MRKLITIITLMFVMSGVTFAQTNQKSEQITVNVSDLDPALVAKIKSEKSVKEVKDKIDAYGELVGVGKEIGYAIDGGLTALTKHADNIANTNVGKFTMVMIAYKVLGEDIVGILFGGILFFIGTIIWCFIFYRNGLNKTLKEITYSEDGKVILKTKERIENPEEDTQIVLAAIYILFILICCFIMFANN